MNMRNLLRSGQSRLPSPRAAVVAAAGDPPASSNSQPATVTPPAARGRTAVDAAADLVARLRLYKGDERTPAGFDVEARPASVTGTLSTRHLKNTDFATGPQRRQPHLRGVHQRHGAGHRLVGAPGHLAGSVFGSRRSAQRHAHVRSGARAARRRHRDDSPSRVPLRLSRSLEHATCAPTWARPAS